jgi:hypothetical protein
LSALNEQARSAEGRQQPTGAFGQIRCVANAPASQSLTAQAIARNCRNLMQLPNNWFDFNDIGHDDETKSPACGVTMVQLAKS